VVVPVADRGETLAAAMRELDAAEIRVEDVALRGLTLDDVFLRLTGPHRDAAGAARPRRCRQKGGDRLSVARRLEIPEPPRTLASRLRWALADGLTIARRNLSHIRMTPEKLVDITIQPILFVLLFGYVFGSAVRVPGVAYRQFLMPGIFVLGMISPLASTAVGLAQDLSRGIVDRFRSLPMSRAGVLLGRLMSDLAETALSLAIVVPCGFLVGWRPESGGAGRGKRVRPARSDRVHHEPHGHLHRPRRAEPPDRSSRDVHDRVPADVLVERVRPTSGMSNLPSCDSGLDPLSAFVAATRDLLGNGAVAADRVADGASARGVAPAVRASDRDLPAAGHQPIPQGNGRLTARMRSRSPAR
jgi:hypothetical protein